MNAGDLVRRKMYPDEIGLFVGLRTFDKNYECAEVIWFDKKADGDGISTIQKNLIEVFNEKL